MSDERAPANRSPLRQKESFQDPTRAVGNETNPGRAPGFFIGYTYFINPPQVVIFHRKD